MINVSFEQIQSLIEIQDLFEPVKQSFIDYNSSRLIGIPIHLLHFPNNSDAHIKTAAIDGYPYFSIKVATMFPNNLKQNKSPNNGSIFLFDANTGELKAILDDKGTLTDLRTAAAGGIITNVVASQQSNAISVIGTGIQAYHQVLALSKLRAITSLVIYGRNKNNAILLKNKLEKKLQNISITIANSVEEAVKTTTIILTTTSSKTPLIKGEWLQKGQHITAVGADDTFKKELDIDCFKKADMVFVDSLDLNSKYGEYSKALKSLPQLKNKTIEFGKAFSDNTYSGDSNKITIAKLVGLGTQDLAAATLVMNKLA
ncbi:ornithine cyclodeaminase family protein [Aquimarina sp. AD10]|uniref:ornithine cyclodeaminase family protein n=1 Tax=Aquimarina sp. AD10 TaxID=1714849 RepID=UPI000E4E663D|nr:ornithine cyclodeaminase family protein [Aquimarina sp. AD10]AXT62369.1 ornithine cyclodeaminase family protein [Aquimarina sp. AD10]RKM90435.1 ornithine cyclodeaminase family protein [Aquimarina sp. AD10]